ncbi:helix-turn-helix transcriptional regulator [Nocardioides pyridinolyticus]
MSGTGDSGTRRPVGVGLGPRDHIPTAVRHATRDAATRLQVRRIELAERIQRRSVPGVELLTGGLDRINDWLLEAIPGWQEMLSIRDATTAANLRASLPANRRFLAAGLRMTSILDNDGTRPDARVLVANEPVGDYYFGVGPMSLKIADRRLLLLSGPVLDGEESLLLISAGPCIEAAWKYWELALESSYPARGSVPPPAELTPRQHQVVALLANDLGDAAIAEALGVSVRTIRSDVAAILGALGVRSRFAAGLRLSSGS